nr:TonB-dependent receptor [Aestuariibacter halophilus]
MKLTQIASAVALCVGVLPAAVMAQAQTAEEQSVEVIDVTGTYIKGVDLEGAQPLTILDAESISRSGASTLAELMSTVSQTRGGTSSFDTAQSGATSTSTPAGQAAASLRGMGPASTLTLINGRRIAASSFAAGTQNFVDINSIPLAAIERVEILATGASATYGADAVAGVINYILKDDYDGAEINLSYGNSTASSDEGKWSINALWGGEVADGHLMLFADYFDRNAFKATDRAYLPGRTLVNSYSYLPAGTPNIYYYSDRDGLERPSPDCQSPLVETEYGETICPYYGYQHDYLQTPTENLSAGLSYTRDIGDITWQTDLFYSTSDAVAYSTPAPINQIDDSEGPFTHEFSLDIYPAEIRDPLLDNLYIDPFTTPAGRTLYGFQFDARFATPRTVEIETDNVRLVTGLSGVYRDWDWQTAITLSRSESSQRATQGIYNRYKYHAAIAGELCADGSIADYNTTTDALTCNSGDPLAMYNPFLQGDAQNDALLALTQEVPTREGESTVYGWDIRASGDWFEFNGEMVKAAVGAEVRREEITDVPSLNARARFENDYLVDVFGFGSSLSEAKRQQWGVFGEVFVPLSDQLQLQLAGRYDDYDDFGDTFNPKVALTYRPSDDLVLRASWATSFRAPSLTQAGVQLRTTTASYDCTSDQTINDLFCGGSGGVFGNNVLELGNPALKPEESESISVGFGYSPTKNTTITVDYWAFDHDDIVDTDMTAVMIRALDDASLRHCGLVPEGALGISFDEATCDYTDANGLTLLDDGVNLVEIRDQYALDYGRLDDDGNVEAGDNRFDLYRDHVLQLENPGQQEVRGIDYHLEHRFELAASDLTLTLSGTHYVSFERNVPGLNEIEELAGQFRYPKDIANASVFWDTDDYYVGLTALYTSGYADEIDRLRGREFDELDAMGALDSDGQRDVSSWTTLRASAGYFWDKAAVRVTIDNLLDRDPPLVYGSARGFDAYNHDANGTYVSATFTYSFE